MIERMHSRGMDRSREKEGELRGIVIAMGETEGGRKSESTPRFKWFVYGEALPPAPSLPFGRWKKAS